MTDIERFQFYMGPMTRDGCIPWIGYVTPDGYGRFRIDGEKRGAHRVAYQLFVGPIPTGMEVDHLCFCRHCVNPEHLRILTPRDNKSRHNRRNAGTTCRKGHAMTSENTIFRKDGTRKCRECDKIRQKAWIRKKRLDKSNESR